jgi:Flp pilus assembly protein TadD
MKLNREILLMLIVAGMAFTPAGAAILEDSDSALFGEDTEAENAMSLPEISATNLLDQVLGSVTNQAQVAEKIVEIRKAAVANPNSPRQYRILGDLLVKANRLDEAAEAYWKASRLEPQNIGHLHFLGFTLLALGDHENGIRIYRELFEQYPNSRKVLFNLASAYYSLDEYEQATGYLGKFMASANKEEPKANYNMGILLLATGRAGDAVPWLERSAQRMPSNPFVPVALARAFTESGNMEKADSIIAEAESKYGKEQFQHLLKVQELPAFIDR